MSGKYSGIFRKFRVEYSIGIPNQQGIRPLICSNYYYYKKISGSDQLSCRQMCKSNAKFNCKTNNEQLCMYQMHFISVKNGEGFGTDSTD